MENDHDTSHQFFYLCMARTRSFERIIHFPLKFLILMKTLFMETESLKIILKIILSLTK